MSNSESHDHCSGLSVATPVEVYNRPGLEAIAYRTGNYHQFQESLLTKLSAGRLPALRELTTRDQSDFTIALLDAWAVAAEVLTFYQERIANESYLSTATERLSIAELAKLIGYELRPGLAAGTYVAFSLDENSLAQAQAQMTGIPRGKEEKPLIKIEAGIKIQSIPGPEEASLTFETLQPIVAKAEWNAISPRMFKPQQKLEEAGEFLIHGSNNQLAVGDILLINRHAIRKIVAVEADQLQNLTKLVVTAEKSIPPEQLPETLTDTLEVFRTAAGIFGSNAQKNITYDGTSVTESPWAIAKDEFKGKIFLADAHPGLTAGSYIAIQNPFSESREEERIPPIIYEIFRVQKAHIQPRVAYGMSGKATYITLDDPSKRWDQKNDRPNVNVPLPFTFLQNLLIYGLQEVLFPAGRPIEDAVEGKQVVLSGRFPGLEKGRAVVITGEREQAQGVYASEVRMIEQAQLIDESYKRLVFDRALDHAYIRSTVRINANVAEATHGETVQEVLGSGNAAQSFQQFVLKQPPLTYTSAATASGSASSLEIRVNDILWRKVPSLYERGPNERIYITRQNGAGQTTVTFGDGINGARLPTGRQNVRAVYRKGTGSQGLLKAHQLTQLITRPLEVKGVTNPIPATGAEDPEAIADARQNANLPIYTLDRIISVQDYEDFARAFSGIGKAKADWAWRGKKRVIHITVAGQQGAAIPSDSSLYDHLQTAIKNAGIRETAVVIDSTAPTLFIVKGKLKVHPDYLPEQVLTEVARRLHQKFAFEKRHFGQAVVLSEVIAAIQSVEGVLSADISELRRKLTPENTDPLPHQLSARLARPNPENKLELLPAELLVLDPESPELTASL